MIFWFISLLPFLPTPMLGGTPLSFIRIGSAAIILSWLVKSIMVRKIVLPFVLPAIFLFGFITTNILSVLWAEEPQLTLRKTVLWLSVFPLTVVFFEFLNNRKDHKNEDAIINRIILSGGVLGSLAILQFVSQFIFGYEKINILLSQYITPLFVGVPMAEIINQNSSWFVNIGGQTLMRAVTTFPEPHTLALFLGLIFPLALSRFVYDDKNKKFWGAILLAIGTGLLTTFSRGAYIAMLVSLVPFIVVWRKKITDKRIIVSVLAVMAIFFTIGNPVATRFISSFDPNDGSNAGRIAIWKNAGMKIKENPIIGVGLGNFPVTQDVFAVTRSPINAHNTYIEIASETGLVGLLLWIGLFISAIRLCFRNTISHGYYTVAVGSGLLFYATHAIFETIIYSPPNLVLLCFLFAVAMNKDIRRDRI